LRKYGWAPHIITIQETKGKLTEKEAALLADVPIYEIESPFDFRHEISRHLDINGQVNTDEWAPGPLHVPQKRTGLKPVLDWIAQYFPVDTWLPLFMLRQKEITDYIKEIEPHILWSTADPWSSHWAAKKLAEAYNLPWVADFRDPWTLSDIALHKRSQFAHHIDQQQEEGIIRRASMLTFTARQTEKLYEQKYAIDVQKSVTIPNSFDSELLNARTRKKNYFEDGYLNLLFFGQFRPLSPAEPFINLLYQLKKSNPELAAKIRMYSFGPLNRQEAMMAEGKGVLENFISFKPIALENALPVLQQADILWLSTHQKRNSIIPAKLWDYLAAKRPIISVAPNPEIAKILHRAGAGIQYDSSNQSALIQILCKAVRAKACDKPMPIPITFDDEVIKQYDAEVATRKLAHIFDRLT
jgi:glycosyltransferase involved in cell wall biosynthesis